MLYLNNKQIFKGKRLRRNIGYTNGSEMKLFSSIQLLSKRYRGFQMKKKREPLNTLILVILCNYECHVGYRDHFYSSNHYSLLPWFLTYCRHGWSWLLLSKMKKLWVSPRPPDFACQKQTQHNASEKEICFLYSVTILDEHNNGAFF